MRYEWLFLDADGTLFDYDSAESNALRAAFLESGLAYGDEALATYRAFNRAVWVEFENGTMSAATLRVRRFEQLFAALGLEADAAAFSPRYLEHLSRGTELLEGAERLVRTLRGRVGMALITNGLKDVQRPRLRGSALHGLFDHVIVSDEIGVAKPSAGFFDIAFDAAGAPAKEKVLVIGDSLTSDIQGGIDYGVDTCWFNPRGASADPRYPATYEIRSLPELYPLVGLAPDPAG
ncbi:MAG TPA: YjjG family noncanonical pyrimidine nucleotidase [Thermoleophilia bacterium]|nr:YjjG family noncanonical pyrimidine nucleotidase [Thermoleophilia bacterium]